MKNVNYKYPQDKERIKAEYGERFWRAFHAIMSGMYSYSRARDGGNTPEYAYQKAGNYLRQGIILLVTSGDIGGEKGKLLRRVCAQTRADEALKDLDNYPSRDPTPKEDS